MDKSRLIKILKVVLIVSMLLFVFVFLNYKTDPCQYCRFNVDGEELRLNKFLDYYGDECFVLRDVGEINLSGNVYK